MERDKAVQVLSGLGLGERARSGPTLVGSVKT